MENVKQSVGLHLREMRRRLGYRTIDAWAEALGVHPNSVGELERGENWLSADMLDRMVRASGLPMRDFFPPGGPSDAKPSEPPLDVFTRLSRILSAVAEDPALFEGILDGIEDALGIEPATQDEKAPSRRRPGR